MGLVLCWTVTGCATVPSPISLTQWSWGRSVDLSRKKDVDPFERADKADKDDVTVVDPDEAPKPKEPRRLFGFGGSDKPKSEKPKAEKPKAENYSSTERPSWFSRTPPTESRKPDVVDEAEERRRQEQYARAEVLVQEGRFAEADELLKPLTKKKKNVWANLKIWTVDPGYREDHNRVREDSLFLLAESYYQRERFNNAKEHYEALLKDYPSTRHLNVATRRLFVIGKTWLGMPEFATTNDVTPVNVEDPRATPQPKKEKPPHSGILVPNLTDKTRP
ncbi:MAG TPA: tetratricopeptide repeat protein, partial [Planctomycetaceae bacterium]|nr:tetratricopeptide repeat protein [Planctomycetaceae bacterium]